MRKYKRLESNMNIVDRILNNNEEKSIFYEYFKDKIEEHGYSDYDLPFPYEFCFFEKDYCDIIKYIDSNKYEKNIGVVDIGCQNGLQSLLFNDFYSYIGIDNYEANFFNTKNSSYIVKNFLDINIDMSNKYVISNMSLGFFDNGKHEETAFKLRENNIEKLFISTNDELFYEIEKIGYKMIYDFGRKFIYGHRYYEI